MYCLSQVELPCPPDGCLHVGDKVCLLHIPSKTLVSAYMSAGQAYEARQIEPNSQLSCSRRLEPCSRNVFVIGRWEGRTVWMGRAGGQAALCGWGGQVGRRHCVDGEGRWAGHTVWMGRAGGQAALCGWGGQVGRPHCVDGEGKWAGRTVWMGRAGGQAALCE